MQANSRSTESESYDPRQRRRRAGRTIALLLAALAIPAAIAGAVALGGGDSGGGSDDPAPNSSYTAEPLEGDGFGTNVLVTARNAHGASAVEPARGRWCSVDGLAAQPLTAPIVKPEMNRARNRLKTNAIGTATRRLAACNSCHL